jgi:hypothetical protein
VEPSCVSLPAGLTSKRKIVRGPPWLVNTNTRRLSPTLVIHTPRGPKPKLMLSNWVPVSGSKVVRYAGCTALGSFFNVTAILPSGLMSMT